MSKQEIGKSAEIFSLSKERKKRAPKKAGKSDVKNWLSASAIILLIGVGVGIAIFGHVLTLGWFAIPASILTVALAIFGARLMIHATNAPDIFGRVVCILFLLGCIVTDGVFEHRGLEALNAWQSRPYIEAKAKFDAARETVHRLERDLAALPALPSDSRELSAFRSRNPETTAYIEQRRASWHTQNEHALEEAREIASAPEPVRTVDPISAEAILAVVIFLAAIKAFGFWCIKDRAAIVFNWKMAKKKAPVSASEIGRNLANQRWGNRP